MTNQDNLRDRIEDTIEAAYAQWEFEFEAHEDGSRAYVDPGPKDAFIAQAIIDEFGLTYEHMPRMSDWPDEFTGHRYMVGVLCRVVGKWEKQ